MFQSDSKLFVKATLLLKVNTKESLDTGCHLFETSLWCKTCGFVRRLVVLSSHCWVGARGSSVVQFTVLFSVEFGCKETIRYSETGFIVRIPPLGKFPFICCVCPSFFFLLILVVPCLSLSVTWWKTYCQLKIRIYCASSLIGGTEFPQVLTEVTLDSASRVIEHCIKKRLQWNTCFARKVIKESEYYEEMMRYLRRHLAVSIVSMSFCGSILSYICVGFFFLCFTFCKQYNDLQQFMSRDLAVSIVSMV